MVQLRHWLLKFYNRRVLFLLLAALIFCWNISILWFSGHDLDVQIFQQLLLLGIVISLEDKFSNLWPSPSRFSFFAGAILLALLLTVSPALISSQAGYIKYLLLPGSICGLALLSRPLQQMQLFAAPLLISLLLPISGAIEVLSSPIQNRLTALLTWAFLYGLGFQTGLSGKEISIGSAGVVVQTPCNGTEQLIFSISMVIIFQLIFPLKQRVHILAAFGGAIVSAYAINTVRIALLAFFTTWDDRSGMPAFDFFHGHGGLIFSLFAATIAGLIYYRLLDQELTT
jgi:exosortase/archaeosortase family protein